MSSLLFLGAKFHIKGNLKQHKIFADAVWYSSQIGELCKVNSVTSLIAGGALTKIRDLTKNLRKSSRDGMTTSLGSSSTLTATGTNGSIRGGPSNGSVVTPR